MVLLFLWDSFIETVELALDAIDAAACLFQLVAIQPGRGASQPPAGAVHDR